ncbi:type II secretion system protein N [Pseudomonas purpurea]|uniref:type II secretion system protein N n=1 Tax=Pseudomonas purpurea TaxID=3136737 RepID=UPI0032666383
MTSSLTTVIARWPTLLGVVLWVLPLGYGAYLFANEGQLREGRVMRDERPTLPAPVAQPLPEFNPDAIATVMGLVAQTAAVSSAEPLTLRASFVSNTGLSRALLAGADGERLYQVGDSLPGGSVLRRVEVSRIVLWRKGREELLALQPQAERSVLTIPPTDRGPAPAPVLLHLRPTADLPPSL